MRARGRKRTRAHTATRPRYNGESMGESTAFSGRVVMALAVVFVMISMTAQTGENTEKPKIIASLFPQYDFARRIARNRAEVTLLLPPGADSHSFEPTPADMRNIAAAALFIYTGPHMEPWAERLAGSVSRPGGVRIVDASRGITPRPGGDFHDHDDEHGRDGHDDEPDHAHGPEAHYHEFDPHIWLDPVMAAIMVDNIAAALRELDPGHAAFYDTNAARLKEEMAALDASFRERVAASPRRTLVFGERFAFGYFFARYGLEEVGAYKSCAPGVEPGMRAVMDTIKYVKEHDVRFIYLEAMATGRISRVINQETGAEILKVDSLHNPPAERQAAGVGYIEIMRENMEAFAKGLEP